MKCERAIVGKKNCFAWLLLNTEYPSTVNYLTEKAQKLLIAVEYCIVVMGKIGISTKRIKQMAGINEH
jgi:hypothetical protein